MDELLLVPNNTARTLAEAQHVVDLGQRPVRAPAIDVLSLWVERMLETANLLEGRALRIVPPRFRLSSLWEQAIRKRHGSDWSATDVTAAARESLEADRLLKHWVLAQDGDGDSLTGPFASWRTDVHAEMRAREWHDGADQLKAFIDWLESGDPLPLPLPASIGMKGFPELTSLEQRLLGALADRGVTIRIRPGEESGSLPSAASASAEVFGSIDEELRDAARWAKAALEAGHGRIAVAVNGLSALRDSVLKHFQHRFTPQSVLCFGDQADAPFHVQGGIPLARHPLFTAATDLLTLTLSGVHERHDFGHLSRWLLSTAWGRDEQEMSHRARLELDLRVRGKSMLSLVDVARAAEGASCPELMELISRIPALPHEGGAAVRFGAILAHWGWPGPLARGDAPRRVVDALVAIFEALDFSEVGADTAGLAALASLGQERSLAGPGGPLSPIQVIDLEALAGQRFDRVRVVNVHADNWPEPVRLNRLLPYSLASALPGASSASQRSRAKVILDAVLKSSDHIEWTRAALVDGVPTAPSPLLQTCAAPSQESEAAAAVGGVLARSAWPGAGDPTAANRDRLRAVERFDAPPVAVGASRLKRVVSLLNTQSACPWAAFLVHRLDAVFPSQPSAFPDLAYIGNLVHEALRVLYLDHLGADQLPVEAEVSAAVRSAMDNLYADRVLAPAARVAEQRRLELLLDGWLAYERELGWAHPMAVEQRREASIGGFRVDVRIDRVDQLPEGSLILDYKTGSQSSPQWAAPRPTDIQLPLYAVLLSGEPERPQGIGLLSVRDNDMGQVIWTSDASIEGKGVSVMGEGRALFEDWEGAVTHWRQAITELLEEYRLGGCSFIVHHEKPLAYLGLELLLRNDAERHEEAVANG